MMVLKAKVEAPSRVSFAARDMAVFLPSVVSSNSHRCVN